LYKKNGKDKIDDSIGRRREEKAFENVAINKA